MARKDKLKEKIKKDPRFKDKTDDEQQDIADFTDEEITLRLNINDMDNPLGNLIPKK